MGAGSRFPWRLTAVASAASVPVLEADRIDSRRGHLPVGLGFRWCGHPMAVQLISIGDGIGAHRDQEFCGLPADASSARWQQAGHGQAQNRC